MSQEKYKKIVIGIIAIAILVFIFFTSVRVNSPTEISVVTRLGQINSTNSAGLYFTIPLIDNVTKYDLTVQSVECITGLGKDNCKALDAATKDLQTVKVEVQVSYRVNSSDIVSLYKLVQDQQTFKDIIVPSAIQESMKATTSKFTAEELVQKRAEVRDDLDKILTEKLEKFSLSLVNLNITNFQFSDAFSKAVDEKSVVQQQIQTQKATLERAQVDAQIKQTQAEAEAKAIKIQNDALQSSPNYLELQKINKWDGKLPLYNGSGQNLILDLGVGTTK